MQLTVELPEDIAKLLGSDSQSISRAVLETILATAVRDAKVSRSEARRMLGLSRYEMDGWLKRHGVVCGITIDELEQDTATALAFSAE
jgi:hypothetical protein